MSSIALHSPSFLPNAFLQPSHLQLIEHPTPPFKRKPNVNKIKQDFISKQNMLRGKPDSIHSIFSGSLISCSCTLFYVVQKLESCWIPPASENNFYRLDCSSTSKKNREELTYFLTPSSGTESELLITFGANASGLRDSICLRVARTVSSWIGLLKHSWHEHGSMQQTPAAKHSQ